MDLQLKGRTVLITGGSKGIGYACAQRFATEGCDLHLVARTAADLETVRTDLEHRFPVRVTTYPLDLSVSGTAENLLTACPDIDILVNNAGAIPGGDLQDIGESTWREAWDLKVFGYIDMCRLAYPKMATRRSGVIVNIIGAAGERPTANYIAGGSANAALMALTRALGASSLQDGVRVVGINPGLIHTERLETLMRQSAGSTLGDEERWRELLKRGPEPGKPEHIADLTGFLASDLAANISGTVITCDGGYSARGSL